MSLEISFSVGVLFLVLAELPKWYILNWNSAANDDQVFTGTSVSFCVDY